MDATRGTNRSIGPPVEKYAADLTLEVPGTALDDEDVDDGAVGGRLPPSVPSLDSSESRVAAGVTDGLSVLVRAIVVGAVDTSAMLVPSFTFFLGVPFAFSSSPFKTVGFFVGPAGRSAGGAFGEAALNGMFL